MRRSRGGRSRPFSSGNAFPHARSQSASGSNWRRDDEQSQRDENSRERVRDRDFRGGPRGRSANRGYIRQDQFARGAAIPDGAAANIRGAGRPGFENRGGAARGGHRQDHTPQEMTYGRLKTWADLNDAGELVLFMSSKRQQIESFLNQPLIKPDWLVLFVKSVSHAITAQHQKESIKQLLDTMCRNRFFEHFATYIEEKQLLGYTWEDAEEFYKSLIDIMEEVLNKLPQYSVKCVTGSSALLNNASLFESVLNNKILMKTVTDFSKRAKEVYMEEKDKEKRGGLFGNSESEKPADNFIDISVVPTQLDLHADSKPFIRSAKTVGVYDDVQHYLDVQFRLMRQDFIFPLQQGIVEFKKNGCKKNQSCLDLRMYLDVHIVGYVLKDGIDHILQFDISKLKNVKWEFSKRLIFGSLLCLSKDNFETSFFATVTHRDAKNLAKGVINVSFKTGLDEVFNSTSNDVYVMAETTAYFESYCHVLEGLKEMVKALPMQDYIIKCKKELRPPRYLLPSQGLHAIPMYDISALIKHSKTSFEVPVLTTVKWPDTDVLCLNKSQKEAAILALTKELAVIQGPPGTGKTYVGLKVMQVLIENMKVISNGESETSPILVVCYTNHALDQFLEGVLQFCPDGIVRVGGKNSSGKLEPFNMRNLKQKIRQDRRFSNLSVRNSKFECQEELNTISDKMINLNQIMNALETDVMSEFDISNVMKDTHFESLTTKNQKIGHNKTSMKTWLNASKHTAKTIMPKMIKKQLAKLVLRWKEVSYQVNLTADMTIFQRVSFYNAYILIYEQNVVQEIQFLSQQNMTPPIQNRIRKLYSCLSIASEAILPDEEMELVLPQEAINVIIQSLRLGDSQEAVPAGKVFETWLLGLHKGLHSQLDDVQMLTSALGGEVINQEMFDDDDESKRAQNDRMIDDEDDDDYGIGVQKSYSTRNKAAMDNMSSVIQRADMLGIREDILLGDDEEDDEDDGDDDGGWQQVSHSKPMSFHKLQQKLKVVKPMTEEMESKIGNVWELDLNQRFALYNLWIKRYKEILTSSMRELVTLYTSASEKKKEANTEETLFLLRSAKVIGMTTTGAAKNRAVLQSLGCRIIVVEEAAEVLESHIVTSLNKNCKHLILIGDHQQLRPSPTVYVLAKEFGLEISLFERLIKNKVPHVLLKEQHRMRPEISTVMQHIYPDLQDHVSVKSYDNIRGVDKNLFFIQHQHQETHVDDTRSKANLHEAKFLVALCQYFLNQGYGESDITILTTYAGQVFAIKKVMKDTQFNHRVRVTAVDNFQGEENEIILLSLVRSNSENNVGFLKVDNRVCVALSRARNGLFVIGNFDQLASQSKLWKNIVHTVNEKQAIGEGLPVVCQNHMEFKQIMTCADDFNKRPDGGCGRNCEYKLNCGHVCGRKCHGYDLEHTSFQCRKNCSKQCTSGHPCPRKCFEKCGNCMVKVEKYISACGHNDSVPCSVPPERAECSQKCDHVLGCEHPCPGKCGKCQTNKKHEKCVVPVTYVWPCEHTATVPCHMNPKLHPCQKVCGADLDCGHKCGGKCFDCMQGSVHVACVKKCEKKLPCGHKCPNYCGVPCLPCTEVCPAQCRHGACAKTKPPQPCSHACTPCKEPCKQTCAHTKCSKLCSDPCDVNICKKHCKNILQKCNHPCSGLCGELCVCAKCAEKIHTLYGDKAKTELKAPGDDKANKELPTNSVDKKNGAASNDGSETTKPLGNASHTDLPAKTEKPSETRIIKLSSCNHIFYVDELDKYVLNFDPDGTSFISCPKCPKPILKCMRYENINKARHEKREEAKYKLKLVTEVSRKQKKDLQMSQKVLEDSVLMTGFRTIDVGAIANQVEAQALSFKLKCAFMLTEIASLTGATSDKTQFIRSRNNAILAIKNRVTSQQKSELAKELQRCFWEHYLASLESLINRHDIDLPQAMVDSVDSTKEDLSTLKPSDDMLTRAQNVASILRRRIVLLTTEETVKAKCLLMEDAAARAIKVMKSRDEDMLCNLVGAEADNTQADTWSFEGTAVPGASGFSSARGRNFYTGYGSPDKTEKRHTRNLFPKPSSPTRHTTNPISKPRPPTRHTTNPISKPTPLPRRTMDALLDQLKLISFKKQELTSSESSNSDTD